MFKTHLPTDINPRTKLSFLEHYNLTLDKIAKIKESGYNLVDIWESDFR